MSCHPKAACAAVVRSNKLFSGANEVIDISEWKREEEEATNACKAKFGTVFLGGENVKEKKLQA